MDIINTLFWVVLITIRIIRLLFDITVFVCNHNCFITVTKLSLWAITTSLLFWCNCWPLYAITITSSLWPSCPYEQSQPVCYSDITVFVCNHNHFITVSKLSLQAITSLLLWHSCLCMQPQLACYWHSIVLVCNHN